MLCRLCINNVDDMDALSLYDKENGTIATLAIKYFNIKVNENDSISTCVCQDCADHLCEFHKFYTYIEEKQKSLKESEFLDLGNKSAEDDSVGGDEHIAGEDTLVDAKNALEEGNVHAFLDNVGNAGGQEFVDEEVPIGHEKIGAKLKETVDSLSADDAAISVDDEDIPLAELKVTAKGTTKKPRNNPSRRSANEELINANMKLSCDICQLAVDSYQELRSHFRKKHKHEEVYVKCCNRKHRQSSRLAEHIRWHLNPDIYRCDICDKSFKEKKNLLEHKRNGHSSKATVHKEDDANDVQYKQSRICDNMCKTKNKSHAHMEKHKRSFPCSKCEKKFPSPSALRNHFNSIHEDIYPYVCESCGRKYKCKNSFERHVLEHQGIVDPPAQCEVCGDWLKNAHVLRLHRRKHDETNTTCDVCGKICPTHAAMYSHKKYKHNTKEFKCEFCEKTFKIKVECEEHTATHTGADLYRCQYCFKGWRSHANMYSHIKRMHPEQWLENKIKRSHNPSLNKTLQG